MFKFKTFTTVKTAHEDVFTMEPQSFFGGLLGYKSTTSSKAKAEAAPVPADAPVLPELNVREVIQQISHNIKHPISAGTVDPEKQKQDTKNELRVLMFGIGSVDQMMARFKHNETKRKEIKAIFEDAEVLDGDVFLKLQHGLEKYEKEAYWYLFIFEKMFQVVDELDYVCFEEQTGIQYFDDDWLGLCNTNIFYFGYSV